MSQFNLTALSEQTPLAKKLSAGLSKATGQAIPYVTPKKVKRLAGVSTRELQMGLENGQTVSFLIKADGDIFRVLLNGKDLPITGDFDPSTFNAAMAEIATKVRTSQKAFDKAQQKVVVKIPKAAGATSVQTTSAKLKAAKDLESQVDTATTQAMAEQEQLKAKLAQAQNNGLPA
jgi:hypothetical protein